MSMKHILGAGLATAFLATAVPAVANDVRDPGRLPRPDRSRDHPAPSPEETVVTANGSAVTAQSEDVRDPGHSTPPDKLRDTVRRR